MPKIYENGQRHFIDSYSDSIGLLTHPQES